MSNYLVQTIIYKHKLDNFYPTEHKEHINTTINDLIKQLENKLKKQKYKNIYHYYDGQNWYIESTNKNNNMKSFKIEENKREYFNE